MEEVNNKVISKNARIAVLMGGMSSERDVSLRSGEKVYEALLRLGYENAVKIDVGHDIANELKDKKIEYAFNVLHGRYGEDGCIQGILEFLQIPYTLSGVKSSAICMDKEITKIVLQNHKIDTIKSVCIKNEDELKSVPQKLKFPLMVKPSREGSSIGMSKVDNEQELQEAFKSAFKLDSKILIEEYLQGESATIGVLEKNGIPFATPILGFKTKTLWYDYEAKYTKGMTEFILPANFGEDLTLKMQNMAIQSHIACECAGASRVDFLVYNSKPYVLEINTSPGMTDLSDLPAQANHMGINYDNLVEIILNTASLGK